MQRWRTGLGSRPVLLENKNRSRRQDLFLRYVKTGCGFTTCGRITQRTGPDTATCSHVTQEQVLLSRPVLIVSRRTGLDLSGYHGDVDTSSGVVKTLSKNGHIALVGTYLEL